MPQMPLALAAFTSFGLAWLALAAMLRFSHKMPQDIPNERSLHLQPLPCIGGLGMVAGLVLVLPWLELDRLSVLLLLALGLSLFSALDDFKPLSVFLRLAVHIAAGLLFLLLFGPAGMSWYAVIVLALVLAWAMNLYNFMDGLDGLAAGMTVIGFATYGVAAWLGGAHDIAGLGLVMSAAAVAFLVYNFHPARLFMGDGGSIPLGFLAAALGLLGWWHGLWPPLFPLLVFSPFIVDASVTLARRIVCRERFWRPHKTHYYQRLVRMGLGHRQTALWAWLLMAAAAGSGLLLLVYPWYGWQMGVGWGLFYLLLFSLIDRRWAAFQAPTRGGAWPCYGPDEIEAVRAVLASGRVNYWTGEECRAFEREYAQQVGCRYAVAVMNGTVALEGAMLALGVGPGDEVVVTPRTFIASASVVMLHGARPVFADLDPAGQNISAATIRPLLTPKTKAIIVVHLAGWPCEMDPIMELARSRGIKVIEDCAQAHGAVYHGRPVGSFGDVAAFSFCQDKIISTGGEGGMVVTNDPEIARRVWSFKDHGKNPDLISQPHNGLGFRWLHDTLGSNWRMTEMQAAIGRCQLRKLAGWVAARRRNAAILDGALRGLPSLVVPEAPADVEPSYYKYYVFVRPERLQPGWDRDRLQAAINAAGVPCFVGSCSEVYLEKAFAAPGMHPESPLPNARRLGETSLMFQVHPTLTAADMAQIAATVREVIARATMEGVGVAVPAGASNDCEYRKLK